jgi:hypothetical protein
MQDRPTAGELLRAAREFCERDLMPELTGRLRFHTRVLVNVLGILEREWEDEEDAVRAEWERLRVLLGSGEEIPATFEETAAQVRAWNKELGSRIRSGAMDDRSDELLSALRETVAEKLAIASPRHSEGASSTT